MDTEVGRPTKYKSEYCEQVYKLCLLGAKDKEIADFFEVSEATLNNWKNEYPEFLESCYNGKIKADATVAESLFKRANGYSHDAVKIFCNKDGDVTREEYVEHYPPDTRAIQYWLNNRQPDKYREKITQEQTGPGGGPVQNELTVKFVEVQKTPEE